MTKKLKRKTEQAFNASNRYRYLKRPAFPGQLRLKAWPYSIAPNGANDPMWVKRAAEYWQLQAETFGLRFHDDIRIMVDYGTGVVVTAVHVAEVLPGRRSRDFTVARVAEHRARSKELVA